MKEKHKNNCSHAAQYMCREGKGGKSRGMEREKRYLRRNVCDKKQYH